MNISSTPAPTPTSTGCRCRGTVPALREPCTCVEPDCETTPAVNLEGMALDITPRKMLSTSRRRYLRVGGQALSLTSEDQPGLYIALRLEQIAAYRIEAFRCLGSLPLRLLPADRRTDDGLVFYGIARARAPYKDEADARRVCKGYIGVWTDGLSLTSANTDPKTMLEPGAAYKVVVRKLGS